MALGVSDIATLTLPVQTHGQASGAVVIEAPLPVGRDRQAEKALRRAVPPVPGVGDRPSARATVEQDRGLGSAAVLAEEAAESRRRGTAIAGGLRPATNSSLFAAQVLAQESEPEAQLEPHRLRGHDASRRSGGEPALFPEEAAIFSFAV